MSSLFRETAGHRRSLVSGHGLKAVPCACAAWASLTLALALLQPGTGQAPASFDHRAFTTLPVESAAAGTIASNRPAFRLGNAARPFGWSTAIGDFNVDGTPDVAVADRISHRASGYAYQIQFLISGEQPDVVTFESAQDAVTISVADIDADSDLDVVVSGLSEETVGVWLNDGHGRFSSSDIRPRQGGIHARHDLSTTDPSADPTAFVVSSRAPQAGLSAVSQVVVSSDCFDSALLRDTRRMLSPCNGVAPGPRAPPTDPASFL